MKYQLYKKDRKEVVPVKETELNKLVKIKLNDIFEKRVELRIPTSLSSPYYISSCYKLPLNGGVAVFSIIFFKNTQQSHFIHNSENFTTHFNKNSNYKTAF